MYHLVVLLAGRAPGRDQLQLGERVAARGGDGGQGAQARRASQVASAASAARDGGAHDSGLLAASARAQRTQFRHLAGPTAAGTALAWDPDGGGGERLSARALHRGV